MPVVDPCLCSSTQRENLTHSCDRDCCSIINISRLPFLQFSSLFFSRHWLSPEYYGCFDCEVRWRKVLQLCPRRRLFIWPSWAQPMLSLASLDNSVLSRICGTCSLCAGSQKLLSGTHYFKLWM